MSTGPAIQNQVLPSVVINNSTYTAKNPGQALAISFINGGVAGAEVVTVSSPSVGSFLVTVQIQSGTSTNLQVKTAIAATTGVNCASSLLSVVITTGHNSDTCTTFNQALLAGGVTAAVAASLTLRNFKLTAKTAGTAGNSITFALTAGATAGSEVVTVNTNAISVQIADGVTNVKQLNAALVASSPANALVALSTPLATNSPASQSVFINSTVTFAEPSDKVNVSQAVSALSFTGGLAAAPALKALQGVTVTSNTNNAAQNGLTVTLSDGATAGAEVVTVDVHGNVTCQVQVGTSTIDQIVTALQAEPTFTALYTATGSGSTTPNSVNNVALTGAVGQTIPPDNSFNTSNNAYFKDQSGVATTTGFVAQPFGFYSRLITLYNDDGAKTISWSFDGTTVAGTLTAGESLAIAEQQPGIYLKSSSSGASYRLVAW